MMPMKNFCGSKFMGSTSSVIFNHTYHRERRTLLQGAGPAQPFQERGGNVTLALTGFGNAISRRCGGRRGTHEQDLSWRGARADGGRRIGAGAPAGPPVSITMVTQLSPTIPQYTRVDIPMLREGIAKAHAAGASGDARELAGAQPQRAGLLRVLRAGQIDLGGIALPTVAGDAPLLDIIDLAGLLSSHEMGRKVAEAVMPELNKDLERFGVRIIATYPFPAQVFFCREPITSLADVKGRRVRTPGGSQTTSSSRSAASRSRSAFRKSIRRWNAAWSIAPSPARHRQRRALVRGHEAHLRAPGAVGRRRLWGEPRLVEQARSGGARVPAEGDDRGAGDSNGSSGSSSPRTALRATPAKGKAARSAASSTSGR